MDNHVFSIVTICRNAENEIASTIDSILNQDYEKIEYIIVDGASTDRTNEIIRSMEQKIRDKCLRFVYISEPDQGISDAFNKGIAEAQGEIIGLINSGDTILPGALRVLDETFTEETDIVYGNTVFVDKTNNLTYLRKKPENVDCSRFAYDGLVFTHQSAFVKKKLYEEVGLYDVNFKLIMDTELFIRFYRHGAKFQYIDRNLVSMLAGGISSRAGKRMFQEKAEIGRRYGGYSRGMLILRYMGKIPVGWIKSCLRKNKKLWYFLIGRKRKIQCNEVGCVDETEIDKNRGDCIN